jgi:GntR family transcriptional regulator, rspAB operon transcriptional repressor
MSSVSSFKKEFSNRMARNTLAPRQSAKRGKSLTSRTYDRLRLDIVECRLRPGHKVSEAELAKSLRTGKTPVREALARLVAEGWMRVVPRQGYIVAPITLSAVRELFETRLLIEPYLAGKAASHVTKADVTELRKLINDAARFEEPDPVRRYFRANLEFHMRIARLAGNSRLAEMVMTAMAESHRMFNLVAVSRTTRSPGEHQRLLDALDEHRQLVKALAEGDAVAARKAAEEHARGTRHAVIEAMLSNGSFAEQAINGNG